MNTRLEKSYNENLKILNSIKGLRVVSAIQEQYFFEGKLDKESMGTLKLEFKNGDSIVFNCDIDAESISIKRGDFSDKGTLGSDFDKFKWIRKDFLSESQLLNLGEIKKINLESLKIKEISIQTGCKLIFESGDFLYVWALPSDNIFYGLNRLPSYPLNMIKPELKEI